MKTGRPGNADGAKKAKTGKIILFAVEIVVLAVLVVGLWLVFRATGASGDESGDGTTSISNGGVLKLSIDEKELEQTFNEEVKENETLKGYRNIALFGVDSREGQLAQKTRTDTIMIASINEENKEVKLVSVYRDTYLNQMGNTEAYGKCNASYAYGGAEQSIKMLNANLDMDITDFITIGFSGLTDVIDALGGVKVEVDSEEIKHINNYQIEMVSKGVAPKYTAVTETGNLTLNGLQATAYCRIRYTAGNDFKRTERQREVLKATLEKAKTASPTDLAKICNNVFSEVYTSLDLTEILELLSEVASYNIVDEAGFPTEGQITTGTIGSKGSCVIPLDLESNVKWLHEFLFDDNDYSPSENVKKYSSQIYNETHPYLTGATTIKDTNAYTDDSTDDGE
ncbi:MAG: LCP family protein [Lachnospiraceae bacterium]|nr:LCP family protein [Lachnospiraceae bacterium]